MGVKQVTIASYPIFCDVRSSQYFKGIVEPFYLIGQNVTVVTGLLFPTVKREIFFHMPHWAKSVLGSL